MNIAFARVLPVVVLAFASAAHANEPDAKALLQASDQSRGGGLPGLVWEVRTTNSGSSSPDSESSLLRVKANEDASSAEILEPLRSKGFKVLQVGRNMWISKPGLKKPVAISPRQRLTGQAALGDIAATAYARDYEAKYVKQEVMNGEPCHLLELTAARPNTTYDKINYWVSVKRQVGVHADFLSVSGKRLKQADFVYDGKASVNGKSFPFVSKMTISDQLTDARTVLEFENVRVQAVPRSEFDVTNLQ